MQRALKTTRPTLKIKRIIIQQIENAKTGIVQLLLPELFVEGLKSLTVELEIPTGSKVLQLLALIGKVNFLSQRQNSKRIEYKVPKIVTIETSRR